MAESEYIIHKIKLYLKVAVKAISPMKMLKRYEEHMQNFSVILMVISNAYGKLTYHVRGSERQDLFLMPP